MAAAVAALLLAGCAGASNVPTPMPGGTTHRLQTQRMGPLAASQSGIPAVIRSGTVARRGALLEYNAGSAVPCAIVTANLNSPHGGTYVAVTNLYTTSDGPGSVSIYKNGATTPSYTLQDPNATAEFFPACGGKGNLYTGFSTRTTSAA